MSTDNLLKITLNCYYKGNQRQIQLKNQILHSGRQNQNYVVFALTCNDENLKGGLWKCTPLYRFFTEMRLCQVAAHQNTPEKRESGNQYLAHTVITFFSTGGHNRGPLGDIMEMWLIFKRRASCIHVYILWGNKFEILFFKNQFLRKTARKLF